MIRVSIVASWTSVIRSDMRIERLWKMNRKQHRLHRLTKKDCTLPPLGLPGEGAENLFKTLARCTGT